MARLLSPVAFTPWPSTCFISLIYAALIISLIVFHTTLPFLPSNLTPVEGINLTEAWQDLQLLTGAFHPYNSRRNDQIRSWLVGRIDEILEANGATSSWVGRQRGLSDSDSLLKAQDSQVYIFDDTTSNLTFSSPGSAVSGGGLSVYFEGTNIIVYVRGLEDDPTAWWNDPSGQPKSQGGVLVNAHYDSVSTAFGATDDGVGVVTILQLIKYYTTSGQRPRRGFVGLLNNGEEDFLNGARAFSQHPIAKLPHSFLNLEGAGAGGKASLFRSTDAEVTRAYARSRYPYGSVLSADGFRQGLIRSQTDYIVFNGILGLRGLDVAFTEPRARYHTGEDDTRHTSIQSMWHMLSAALETTKALTGSEDFVFTGKSLTKGGVNAGHGHSGVWFDLFGRVFAVFRLHTLFALSITLLVVCPVLLLVTLTVLYSVDKLYLFSGSVLYHSSDGDQKVSIYGWRGFFRFVPLFVVAAAGPVVLAYLIFKENPFIAYSSEWAVWSMMFSSWIFIAWFCSRVADWARPSALTRAYGLSWLLALCWAILVIDVVFQAHLKMAGGYFLLFYFASLFLATWISYLELLALPKKSKYLNDKIVGSRRGSVSSSQLLASSSHENAGASPSSRVDERTREEDEGEREGAADENTSLLKRDQRTTFANYTRNDVDDPEDAVHDREGSGAGDKFGPVFGEEQDWSVHLPRWTWLLQIVILVPINMILVGQLALFFVTATHQTGPDGSSMFIVYIAMAAFSILLLSPILPFIHRFTWHIPMFMLLVLIGTLIYNVLAFPFSENNRLKLRFQQEIDLDAITTLEHSRINNTVSLIGPPGYVQDTILSLPSSSGQALRCHDIQSYPGLVKCSWTGLPPEVVHTGSRLPLKTQMKSWVNYNISRPVLDTSTSSSVSANRSGRTRKANSARFTLSGRNTRACKLVVDRPALISNFHVHGSGPNDKRFPPVPSEEEGGTREIRLWSRTWDRAWVVDVEWEYLDEDYYAYVDGQADGDDGKLESSSEAKLKPKPEPGLTGNVICLWSDENHEGVIPALDEVRHFAPLWTTVTKAEDGLVEGRKRFEI